jgi:hypothetical protein
LSTFCTFEAKGGVLEHGAVREQRDVLEDHADMPSSDFPQLRGIHSADVASADEDLAEARLDQTVEEADERGLAATRQSHDAEDLALGQGEADVGDADDAAELLQDLGFAEPALVDGADRYGRLRTEHLPDRPTVDQGAVAASDGFRHVTSPLEMPRDALARFHESPSEPCRPADRGCGTARPASRVSLC